MKFQHVLGVVIASISLLFLSCEKFDLPRDNPYDMLNDNNIQDGVALGVESYSIVEDDNFDGIANKNETVYLFVEIANYGENKADKVRATFTPLDSNVSNFSPTDEVIFNSGNQDQDYISAGDSQYGATAKSPENNNNYAVKFDVVDIQTTNSIKSKLLVEITDAAGHEWQDTLTIEIKPTGANLVFSKFYVQGDNNSDGEVNLNETVYLQVRVKNTGTSTATNVMGVITSNSPYVRDVYPTAPLEFNAANPNYHSIIPNSENYSNAGTLPGSRVYNLRFTVDPTTPALTELPFTIHLTDDNGNQWEDTFTVIVTQTGAVLVFSKYSVMDDEDGNGKVSPGEKVFIRTYIRNNGVSRANEVYGHITTTNPNVLNLLPAESILYNSNTSNLHYVGAGAEVFGYYKNLPGFIGYSMEFEVDSNATIGTELDFFVDLEDEEKNTWQDTFIIKVE